MSEVKTSKLSPRTASGTLTLGTSGDTFTVPSGVTVTNNGTITNSGTATGFGLFTSYAIIADQKATAAGGTFTSGAWRTRDLNTEIADPDGIVSIATNQFTLAAGSYLIKWVAPAHNVSLHQTRLYNVTDAAEVEIGMGCYVASSVIQTTSIGSARTTITGPKAFTIEHYCYTTYAGVGFGQNMAFGVGEQYTIVEIFKEA